MKTSNDILSLFSNIFKELDVYCPRLEGVSFRSISFEVNLALTPLFILKEIDGVMSLCNGYKSLGLDEFNSSFFKRLWNLLRTNVGIMFDEFYWFVSLPHSVSSLFVTIVPKVKNPTSFVNFIPIPLVGFIYKLVAQVLA